MAAAAAAVEAVGAAADVRRRLHAPHRSVHRAAAAGFNFNNDVRPQQRPQPQQHPQVQRPNNNANTNRPNNGNRPNTGNGNRGNGNTVNGGNKNTANGGNRNNANNNNNRTNVNNGNRNNVNVSGNTINRTVVANPVYASGGAWGWNHGVAWAPAPYYWGGGFWGAMAVGVTSAAVGAAVYGSIVSNNTTYTSYQVQPSSPGATFLSSYQLTQVQCGGSNQVVVYGPQNSVICANPNNVVQAGNYTLNTETLTLSSM